MLMNACLPFLADVDKTWTLPPLLDPIVDPFLDPPSGPLNFYGENKQKYKLKLYNMCASCRRFFCTLVSFDLAFGSKEGVPLHTAHFH